MGPSRAPPLGGEAEWVLNNHGPDWEMRPQNPLKMQFFRPFLTLDPKYSVSLASPGWTKVISRTQLAGISWLNWVSCAGVFLSRTCTSQLGCGPPGQRSGQPGKARMDRKIFGAKHPRFWERSQKIGPKRHFAWFLGFHLWILAEKCQPG